MLSLLLHCMKSIQRTTEVISVSLPKNLVRQLDRTRKMRGQSRSAVVASLVNKIAEEERWNRIYKRGETTARQFRITSEDDIERILNEP